jgi:Flp pilus assembly protein TadG
MDEDGYATAEAAVALPALLVVLSLAVGAVVTVGAQLRCVDAARAAAREVARGDSDGTARRDATQIAPRGATVTVRRHGGDVDVTVTAVVRPTRWLPGFTVKAHAVTEVEP